MHIHRWIEQNIPRDGIIVEGGSWDGLDTWFFSQHLRYGNVYTFEPLPEFYYEVCERMKDYPNVEVSFYALAEKTGEHTLYISEKDGKSWCSNSILKPKLHKEVHPTITFEKEMPVMGINLDDWIEIKKIEKIDFMWLDIQGAEPAVLRAAPKTLSITKYIYTEVSLVELYEGVLVYNDFKAFMESQGFEVIQEDLIEKDQGDVLFKNTRL